MKLKELEVTNFKNIEKVQVEFGETVTHIYGLNGAGKSTLLDGIWACFKGIGKTGQELLIGDRWRMIGPQGKSAKFTITLIDEMKGNAEIKIMRKVTKTANDLTFEAPKDYPINNKWVSDLLSVAFFNSRNFTKKSPREQALLLDVDTSEHDTKIAEIKDEAKVKRSAVADCGEIESVEKMDKVDVSKLWKEKEQIKEFNDAQDRQDKAKVELEDDVKLYTDNVADLKNQLSEQERKLASAKKDLKALKAPQPHKSFDGIQWSIDSADETNRQAELYIRTEERIDDKCRKKDAYDRCFERQIEAEQKRTKYIQSCNFAFDGLSTDENGGLTLTDKSGVPRHINERSFSTGELDIIVAKLYASRDPELKTIFIDNFENLDEPNQKKIVKEMKKLGLQIITSSVGEPEPQDNIIVLREGAVVSGTKEVKKPNLF